MVDKTAPRQQPSQTEDLRACVRACGLVLEDRRSIITTMLLGGVKAIDLATIDCHTCGHPTVTTYNPLYTRVYRKCSHDSMLWWGGGLPTFEARMRQVSLGKTLVDIVLVFYAFKFFLLVFPLSISTKYLKKKFLKRVEHEPLSTNFSRNFSRF